MKMSGQFTGCFCNDDCPGCRRRPTTVSQSVLNAAPTAGVTAAVCGLATACAPWLQRTSSRGATDQVYKLTIDSYATGLVHSYHDRSTQQSAGRCPPSCTLRLDNNLMRRSYRNRCLNQPSHQPTPRICKRWLSVSCGVPFSLIDWSQFMLDSQPKRNVVVIELQEPSRKAQKPAQRTAESPVAVATRTKFGSATTITANSRASRHRGCSPWHAGPRAHQLWVGSAGRCATWTPNVVE